MMADEKRKKMIKAIHTGKARLGWDDEAYRAFLWGVTGRESAAALNERELAAVLDGMRRAGFAAKPRRVKPEERGGASLAQLEYIKGMWQVCARNKNEYALLQFVKRVARVDALRFLDGRAAQDVILALRDMMEKAGYDPDTSAKREAAE
jgi:phage gp16-like protein